MNNRTLAMLQRRRVEVVGIAGFLVVALTLTLLIAGTLVGGTGPTHTYEAVFANASGLGEGDDVRIAGVRVGKVEDVELDGTRARVTFTLEKDQDLYTDTTATIDFLNLLGQRYLSLEGPMQGEVRGPGSTIPLEQTDPGLDLTAVFNAFRPLFDMIKPEDVNELATNIVQVLQGQGPTLQHLAEQTARLTRHLVDRDEVIGAVIDNLTVVMETMDDHRAEFRSMIHELNDLTGVIARNRVQIGATIDSVHALVGEFAALVDAGGDSVVRAVDGLAAWSQSFAGVAPELGTRLKDAQRLLTGYIRSLGLGSYLNTYVCESHVKVGNGPAVDLSLTDQSSRRCS